MLAGLALLLAPLLFLWVSSGRLLLHTDAPGQCVDEEKTTGEAHLSLKMCRLC
jgi:hypothetical protein